jgi:NitT/TauT family transport system permease protein
VDIRSRLSGIVIVATVWELVSRIGILPSEFFPPITTVFVQLYHAIISGEILRAELITVTRAAVGVFIAACFGMSLAILTSTFRTCDALFAPIAEFLRPLPPTALIPISIFFLGIGPALFLFTIALAAIWPIYISTTNALRSVDRTLIETGRSFGCGRMATLWHVRIPSAMPEIITGLRISVGLALLGTVVVEMLAGRGGIGYLLFETAFSLRVAEMFGVMIVAGLNGILFNFLVLKVGQAFAGWHLILTQRHATFAVTRGN